MAHADKYTNQPDAGQVLLNHTVDPVQTALYTAEQLRCSFHHPEEKYNKYRKGYRQQQPQLHMDNQRHNHTAYYNERNPCHKAEAHEDRILQL
ncbi:hypothetical protein D3C81_1913530 [compost metagenome]